MIKANELRIGNLYDNNGNYFVVTPSTIESVFESERVWCKPIPLTEEILLKCGGTIEGNGYSRIIIETGSYPDLGIGSGYILHSNGYIMQIHRHAPFINYEHIKYLHQFQNLFYFNENKELKINL